MPSSMNGTQRWRTTGALSFSGALALSLSGCGGGLISIPAGSASGTSTAAIAVKAGPQLGYLWDSGDQTLRPILGMPGASQIGESVVPAGTYTQAAGSPSSAVALLVSSDQKLYRMSLPSGTPAPLDVNAAAGAALRFSPSGISAAVFVPGSAAVTVLTGLTATPQTRIVSPGGPIMDLAISDHGTVAAVLQSSSGDALVSVSLNSAPQPLLRLEAPGGLSFVGASDDLLAADAAASTLSLIRAVSTAPTVTPVSSATLLQAPVAVGASFDGRWAVVANGGESSVVRFDLSGATPPLRLVCPIQPTTAAQLAGVGTFRFTPGGNAPGWVADITAPQPTMMFVPALPSQIRQPTAAATPASSAHGL